MKLLLILFFYTISSTRVTRERVNISSLFSPETSLFYFTLNQDSVTDFPEIKVVNPFEETLLSAFLQVKYTPCLKL